MKTINKISNIMWALIMWLPITLFIAIVLINCFNQSSDFYTYNNIISEFNSCLNVFSNYINSSGFVSDFTNGLSNIFGYFGIQSSGVVLGIIYCFSWLIITSLMHLFVNCVLWFIKWANNLLERGIDL